MEKENGARLRQSRQAVFDVLRPIVRVLRETGFREEAIHAATDRACRLYAHSPARGIWLDEARLAGLTEAIRVWSRDPAFIDATGSPMKLDLRLGEGAGSFRALLRKAGCPMTAHDALAQLQSLGAVQSCDRGQRVRVISTEPPARQGMRFLAAPALASMRRFAETLEHTLCERPGDGSGRLHRVVSRAALDAGQVGEVQRFTRSIGRTFLEAVDDKLASCARQRRGRAGPTYGVGLYVFMEEPYRSRRAAAKRRKR